MSKFLAMSEQLGIKSDDGITPAKYGILVDTNLTKICVLRFFNHQDLLDIILSDTYNNLILYRTQYHLPSDDELEELYEKLLVE